MKHLTLFIFLFASSALTAQEKPVDLKQTLTQTVNKMLENKKGTREPTSTEEKLETSNVENNNVEKIKVTGSRIKRIDMEGPNPLTIIEKEELENSGYSSVGDFLRDTTITKFGVSREHAGSSSAGLSTTSVNGAQTLTLINGLRVVSDPNAEAVDLNMIPIFAIERVEILTSGGSALYGSDAIGGVINFITKKDFSGIEIHGQLAPTIYKGGSRADLATVFGKSNKTYNFIGSVHLRGNRSIKNSEREWSKELLSSLGPYFAFNDIKDYSSCPKDRQKKDSKTGPITGCDFNTGEYSTHLPEYGQLSTYLNGSYKLNETTLYSQALLSFKRTKWSYAPIPGRIQVPANHKMKQGAGQEGTLLYRFMEAGNRVTTTNTLVGEFTLGAKGYLSATWDYDFSVKFAHYIKRNTNEGLLLKKELVQALVNGDYDASDKENRNLSNALYTAHDNNTSNLIFSSLDFSGETGFWNIDLATGFQAHLTDYTNTADKEAKAGNILSNAGSDGYGNRYVFSYYLEGGKNFSDLLEIQLAGRVDYYSKFGLTGNPKLSVRFQPHSDFLIRGSIGTGFIAPSLHSLHQSISESYPFLFDTVACYNELKEKKRFNPLYKTLGSMPQKEKETFAKDFLIEQRDVYDRKNLSKAVKTALKTLSKSFSDPDAKPEDKIDFCKPRQYHALYGGNKKLKHIDAIVASVGSQFQISDNSSLGADIWYTQLSNIPGSGVGKQATDVELKNGNDHVKDIGINLNRSDNEYNQLNTLGYAIETKSLNLSSAKVSGMDIRFNADFINFELLNGNLYFKNKYSYVFFFRSEGFPGFGHTDSVGKFGAPSWRNFATLGWKINKKHNISLTANSTASVRKKSSELEDLPSYTRFDLDYQFAMSEKTSFKFGWSNLLFSTPPLDEGSPSGKLDSDIFENRGPFFFVGFKHLI